MSNLLLDEHPLLVMPKLAKKIGLNEAIILQQIHYWNEINKRAGNNFKDGYYWTYNSYENWKEQFPFWHKNTISRTINNLQKLKLLVSANYNRLKIDRTKWYRIDYEALQILETSPFHQIGVTNKPNWCDHLTKMRRPLPETTAEINTKSIKSTYIPLAGDGCVFINIYKDYFRRYMGREHMRVTEEQLQAIESAMDQLMYCGVDEEEFEQGVIEHFERLASTNNGNILAFLHTCKRRFEVDAVNY